MKWTVNLSLPTLRRGVLHAKFSAIDASLSPIRTGIAYPDANAVSFAFRSLSTVP